MSSNKKPLDTSIFDLLNKTPSGIIFLGKINNKPSRDVTPSHTTKDNTLNELIRIATTSENMLQRMEAEYQHGNGKYSGSDLENVFSTLEKVISYDQDRTIRNFVGKFYSQKIQIRENAISDAS